MTGLQRLSMIPLLAFALTGNAQRSNVAHPATAPQASASISGRIFGITGSGDLKPARLAHVFLLYERPTNEEIARVIHSKGSWKPEENTVNLAFLSALQSGMTKTEALARTTENEQLVCRSELMAYTEALLATADWVQQNKKSRQFLTTDADEDGLFRIARVQAGIYTLVARGRAGANDAVWKSELTLKPGDAISVKLSAPEKSCLVSP